MTNTKESDQPTTPGAALQAQVAEALRMAFQSLKRPTSKKNADSLAIDALIYDYAEKFCKGAADQAWAALELPDRDTIPEGDSILYDGDVIAVTAAMTKPINRFNEDALADLLKKSKYKIPIMQTKDFIAKSKKPTKGRLTLTAVLK